MSAKYGKYDGQIKLIFSVDFSGSDEVFKTIQEFQWPHGEMEIIRHKKHLGLKTHILNCGDLVETYENIILLEDDLAVSPYFYDYAVSSLDFYGSSENIAGISLYTHTFNESANLPFIPLQDDSDVFFLQISPSSGQLWTREKWTKFRTWYNAGQVVTKEDDLPENVIAWRETSWKKYFIKFAVETDMYFVYPRVSYTTNFGDIGTHANRITNQHQVPLSLRQRDLSFIHIKDSISVYDVYCELLPSIYQKLNPDLVGYTFESDLYGAKKLNHIKSQYILTSKNINHKTALKSFDIQMKPMELNITYNIKGDFIHLVDVSKINTQKTHLSAKLKIYEYFYRSINKSHCILYIQKKFDHILKRK